ncbi:MAG: ABC transporter substrate-binding protein [Peptococcaceae bacterium]|jgi:peptide/nickel transport system substrate-binding protein|nr:ABC transporter substrate-binding protein [Peptococcaceae bacterium]
MRKKSGKNAGICLVILIIMTAGLWTGCGGGGAAPADTSAAGTSAAADGGAPAAEAAGGSGEKIIRMTQAGGYFIDPGVGVDYASMILCVNLYDSLVYPDLDGTLKAGAAEEGWEVSEDGLTWNFTLRPGIKFHDGTEMKASDVTFSVNRMLTMGEGFAYLFADYVDKVEAIGDYGVQFILGRPFAPFLRILPRIYILNEAVVRENQAEGPYGVFGDYGKAYLAEHDAGSGAYYCEAMLVQDRVIMKRFDGYFGEFEPNAPDTVEIITGTEPAAVRALMSSGQLEISDQWQPNEAYDALDGIEGVSVGSMATGQILFLMLNTAKAPTDDVHVRRAISHLIDYDQVINVLFPGYLEADSPVLAGLPGHAEGLSPYEFSLDKAREELALSAYADQLDSIAVEVVWISEVPDEEKLALLIQANAQQIGLKVNVTRVPWSAHVNNVAAMETTPNAAPCYMGPDYDEGGATLYQRFHSDTSATWQQIEWLRSDAMDAQIDSALVTVDQDARFAIYADIQREVMDGVYGISVAESAEKHAYCDFVKWPAMERANRGENMASGLGYNYQFRTFEVNK